MTTEHSLFLKFKQLIKFMLFMEDNPKHRVAEDLPLILIMLLPNCLFIVGCLACATFQYGIIIGFFSVAAIPLTVLEIFHFIFDR